MIFAPVTALPYQFGSFPALITHCMFPRPCHTLQVFPRLSPVARSEEKDI